MDENYEDLMYELTEVIVDVCEAYMADHSDFVDNQFILDSLTIARQEFKEMTKDEEISEAVDNLLNSLFEDGRGRE